MVTKIWLMVLFLETSVESFNILILNEKENMAAGESSLAALEYINRHSQLNVQLSNIAYVNSSNCDGETFLDTVCSVYKSLVEAGSGPHLVIDLTRCREVSNAAERFIRKIGLPAVSTSPSIGQWKMEERAPAFHVELFHPLDMIILVVHTLIEVNHITNVAILYDETFGSILESEYVLRDMVLRLIVVKLDSMTVVRRLMVEMRELDVFNYVVLGSLSTIRTVTDNSDCDSYWSRKLTWYIISQEEHQLKFSCQNMSVLLIKPDSDKSPTLRTLYSLNTHSDLTSSFYFEIIVKSLLAFRSFVTFNRRITSNFSHTLCDGNMDKPSFDKEAFDFIHHFKKESGPEVNWNSNERGYMDLRLRLEVVGTERVSEWRPNYQTSASLTAITPRTVYKVVTVLQPPFVVKSLDDSGAEQYVGFCIDLLRDIGQLVGFDFEIYVAPDNSFGTRDAHGNWNGLIKELINKKADIGLTSLSITAERENVVEFTVPFYDLVGMTILMKKHSPQTSHFKFLAAMEEEVWLCVVVTYAFASFLLWMFAQFNPHTVFAFSSDGLPTTNAQTLSLKDCLWFCMTSLTPQGSSFSFRNLPAYITVATWWLFGFVILSSYTANLAAFLTVSRLDREIQTLSDLAKQSGIQYAPINGSSGMTYFERMAEIEQQFHERWKNLTLVAERGELAVWEFPLSARYIHIWAAMQEAGLPNTLEDAVERVLASKSSSDGFAYIGDGTNIRYQVIIHCNLQMVGEEFGKLPLGIALQKNSPIKESMNKAITSLLNQRRLEKLKEIWWDENPARQVCDDHVAAAQEGVYLSNIGGVYSLVVLGVIFACCTLVFEYCGSRLDAPASARAPGLIAPHLPPFHNWNAQRPGQHRCQRSGW